MSDRGASAALESYLARLGAALAGLPARERDDILLETRSHVLERTRRPPPRTVEQALAELGPPGAYARRFLPEAEAGNAPAQPAGPLAGLARLATGRWTALPLLMLVATGYAIAAFALAMAVAKLLEPDGTGLWIEQVGARRHVHLVMSNPDVRGRDVLGYGIVPLGLFIAAAIHLGVAALLRRVVRTGAPARPAK